MAVSTVLRCANAARRVWEMRVERLTAVTLSRNGLLLRINPFAIRILRADHDRAGRSNHRHPISLHCAVFAEHENVVTHDLRIVSREVSISYTLEFI